MTCLMDSSVVVAAAGRARPESRGTVLVAFLTDIIRPCVAPAARGIVRPASRRTV